MMIALVGAALAGSILHNACAALGVAGRASTTFTATGRISGPGFAGVQNTSWRLRELGLRQVVRAGYFSASEGFDGAGAWSGDQAGVTKSENFPQSRRSIVTDAFVAANGFCGASGSFAASIAAKTGNGWDVRIVPAQGEPFHLYVDATTHLPTRIGRPDWAGGPSETMLGDYRVSAGIVYPFLQRTSGANPSTLFVSGVKASEPVSFARPTAPPHDVRFASAQAIPFLFVHHQIFVKVYLEGQGPFTMLFDSGGLNTMTRHVASLLRRNRSGHYQSAGAGTGVTPFSLATVTRERLGNVTLLDQPFFVVEDDDVIASQGLSIDGIVGNEFLMRAKTTIDYRRRTLVLQPFQAPVSSGMSVGFSGNVPNVRGSVDGIPGWLTIDSGSHLPLMLFSPFVRAHPNLRHSPVHGTVGYGFGGGAPAYLGRVAELRLGNTVIRNPVATFSTAKTGLFADPNILGNVGSGLLQRFVVTFDYQHGLIALRPQPGYAPPEFSDNSGLFLISKHGAVVVEDVLDATAARRAGVRPGDLVVSINGRKAAASSLSAARALFEGPPGTRIDLVVRRNDALHTLRFTLQPLIGTGVP